MLKVEASIQPLTEVVLDAVDAVLELEGSVLVMLQLEGIGVALGPPARGRMGEAMVVAAKMRRAGWKSMLGELRLFFCWVVGSATRVELVRAAAASGRRIVDLRVWMAMIQQVEMSTTGLSFSYT